MARIIDNIELKFEDGLRDLLTATGVKRADFCVGYFNLRGWNLVAKDVNNLCGDYVYEEEYNENQLRTCRLLIGMVQTPQEILRLRYGTKEFNPDNDYVNKCIRKIVLDFRNQLTIGCPTAQDEQVLLDLLSQLKNGKLILKLYLREPLHAKLYLGYRPEDNLNKVIALMGSSNLTYNGLTKQGELNAEFTDSDHAEKLANWFEERWNDSFSVDITNDLIKVLEESWINSIIPYHIYLKTAYHLCQDVRNGVNEYDLPIEFKEQLFEFQETAVKIITKNLHKRGGAMIGDVVGLGKTITACAVAKLYEINYAAKTLIICPANLQDMWRKYINKYNLKAEPQSMQGQIDIDNGRFNYRLIIIDESHNLRNANGTRYRNIKKLIEQSDAKVLLLTATPYNKDYRDIINQLRLFVSDDVDLGIRPEKYISSLGGDRAFQTQHNDIFIRSLKAFERSSFEEDWRDLMKLFLVRRTRTFIKKNYAKLDSATNRPYLQFPNGNRSYFPNRIPKACKFQAVSGDQYSRLYSQKMLDYMQQLLLPRYGLSAYIDSAKKGNASQKEQQIIDNLSQAGQRMMGFCRSTFFKRIDSSGVSFLRTLYRHIVRNMIYVYAIENNLPIPIGDENIIPEDFLLEDQDFNESMKSDTKLSKALIRFPQDLNDYKTTAQNYYDTIKGQSGIDWLPSTLFEPKLREDLNKDNQTIIGMIQYCQDWNADEDQKLRELFKLLSETHSEEKVLVFTQYSDTAEYITNQLRRKGIDKIEYVCGNSDNITGIVKRFSPRSNANSADSYALNTKDELRVLVATDVLSEGQNLQDAHIIVNYDLPWAIIRLIQRAGRVDRIGQENEEILCYSFFPADGVEDIIGLRQRLNERINQNAGVVGSDEVFFEGNETNLRNLFDEKSGILDDADDDVDLASLAYQIWKNAIDVDPKLKDIIPNIPNVAYSTRKCNDATQGVITYTRNNAGNDMLTWLDTNGCIISQSQTHILKTMACDSNTPKELPLPNHHDIVRKAIEMIDSQDSRTMGVLGNKLSTKYRLVSQIENHICSIQQAAEKEELKSILDDLYMYPMYESAKSNLSQMLRHQSPWNDIQSTLIDLYRANALCVKLDDNDLPQEPQIICSMGLIR